MSDLLNNQKFIADTAFAQQKIDQARVLLTQEPGLSENEINEIPGSLKQGFVSLRNWRDACWINR